MKKNKISKNWLIKQNRDPFFVQSKIQGYRSRSAFKLIEMNKKFNFLNSNTHLVDLGSSPGGWAQIASKIITKGKILAVDIKNMEKIKNVYLTNGLDNLALHLNEDLQDDNSQNRLDHFGIMLQKSKDVDYWYSYIQSKNVKIHKQINSHRDGSRSFYCCDPDGNVIQVIWHPSSK